MKAIVKDIFPDSFIPYYRTALQIQRAWLRRIDYALDRRALSSELFFEHLRDLGFIPGATIYLHSSMDAISRRVPSLNAVKLINLLREMIGEDGTLLMPTFPFGGKQYNYVQNQKIFNVKRTPSQVGLFTELFRRTKGVERSLHPTHPVAAWGKHSNELVAEHHLGTAFGEKSPVYKMQQYNGLVAGIGVKPKHCYSLYHMVEELHPVSRAIHYGHDKFEMTIINGKEEIPYSIIPMRPDRVRIYGCADRILQKEKILRYYSLKGLEFSVTNVHDFMQRSLKLIDEKKYYGK